AAKATHQHYAGGQTAGRRGNRHGRSTAANRAAAGLCTAALTAVTTPRGGADLTERQTAAATAAAHAKAAGAAAKAPESLPQFAVPRRRHRGRRPTHTEWLQSLWRAWQPERPQLWHPRTNGLNCAAGIRRFTARSRTANPDDSGRQPGTQRPYPAGTDAAHSVRCPATASDIVVQLPPTKLANSGLQNLRY